LGSSIEDFLKNERIFEESEAQEPMQIHFLGNSEREEEEVSPPPASP
jgi:hypothetical protein